MARDGMGRAEFSFTNDQLERGDGWLLEGVRRGEAEAFTKLVLKYQNKVFSLALRVLGDRAEAEDVAQEVFVKVFRSLDSFKGESKFATWLYTIISRVCLNRLKALKRHRPQSFDHNLEGLADNSPRADESLEAKALQATVEAEIGRLSEEQRVVLILRDIQGFSYEEIAHTLGLELGTVRSRLHRARMALKERLEKLL